MIETVNTINQLEHLAIQKICQKQIKVQFYIWKLKIKCNLLKIYLLFDEY